MPFRDSSISTTLTTVKLFSSSFNNENKIEAREATIRRLRLEFYFTRIYIRGQVGRTFDYWPKDF